MEVMVQEGVREVGLAVVREAVRAVGPDEGQEDVGLDLVEAEMAAAVADTRGIDSNTGIEIQMDKFYR